MKEIPDFVALLSSWGKLSLLENYIMMLNNACNQDVGVVCHFSCSKWWRTSVYVWEGSNAAVRFFKDNKHVALLY